jgi:hypothetical protein
MIQSIRNRVDGRLLALLAVGHALLVLVAWWQMFYTGVELFSARWWLVFAWLWAAWPFMLLIYPARPLLWTWMALGMGALLLTPCVPTIFAFTVWTIWSSASF